MSTLNWLHFSDLHAGMKAQEWLWPRFERDLLEDLSRLHEKAGPWHLILFTGDIVRTGVAGEFSAFEDILGAVLSKLRTLGSTPQLITLPGNHDLRRPSKLDSKAVALGQYANLADLRSDFWSEDKEGYRAFTNSLFADYMAWREKSVAAGVHLQPERNGLLAGDASYKIDAGALTAKIVALNSTWLQIAEGDFEGKLEVHPLQLIHAVPDKPDVWLAAGDIALIATHQPIDWLTQQAQESWRSDIYTPDRFDLHAFGHMHAPETRTFSRGGGNLRRELQAASLFGLEQTAKGVERIQGYAAYRARVITGGSDLTIWPRRLTAVAGGEKKLKPDIEQDLNEDNAFVLRLDRGPSTSASLKAVELPADSFEPSSEDDNRFKLENIEILLPVEPGHGAVRLADQQVALDAWGAKSRAFWLTSDWGFGEDGFIGSVKARVSSSRIRAFRLSLENFRTKADFLESVRTTHGATFEEICDRIATEKKAILILADAPLRSPATPACQAIAAEIESLVYATRDYLENGLFVITSRFVPSSPSLPVIELTALDEPDIRSYVTAQRATDPTLASAATISRLFQLTDGHPGRLDAALKQLEVVSLNELAMTNSDLERAQPGVELPVALPAMIAELKAEGLVGERAFALLQSLALFPGGEQLDRLKRFDNAKPYFPPHAAMLLDRHLIDAVTYNQMGDSSSANEVRLLVVPRPVREFVRSSLSLRESARLDRRALELYFGEEWKAGLAKGALASRIAKNPVAAPHELANCNTIVLRALVRAIESANDVDVEAVIRVAIAFLSQQIDGGHYRNALVLCEDLIPHLRGFYENDLSYVEISRARCLRMTGRPAEARDAYLNVNNAELSNSTKQDIALGLAMSYNSNGQTEEGKAAAEAAIKLNGKTLSALHARVLLAQQEPAGPARDAKLLKLLQTAKARKSSVLENNIKIFRAERANQDERKKTLREVIDTAPATGDFYNRFRAILRLFEDREPGSPVAHMDKLTLITAYHFFHNERMDINFNRVHSILWKIFEEEGDIWNLLSLFRHSSFIWRLGGITDSEQGYIDLLRPRYDAIVGSNQPNLTRERKYFLTRLQAIAEA